ncbi:MAG: Lrp/AsnC family transcriptional regulator [Parvibaculaceae bacterium]
MKLDKIDRKILQELIEDARIPIVTLAQRVGLSKSPCQRRVRILEESGLIDRFTVEVNPSKAGIKVVVYATVEFNHLSAEGLENFEQFVLNSEEISECYVTTGTSDYLIKIVAPDFEHYDAFIKSNLLPLPGIRRINTMVAYRSIKNRMTLPKSLIMKQSRQRQPDADEKVKPVPSRVVLGD